MTVPTPVAARSPHPGLTLGPLTVDTPVVLAPMAGITDAAYRRLCAEQGAGLYVCEMITSRGLVERDEVTLSMLTFDETETTRSVQLYGTDPAYVGKATEILCAEHGVDHVDLNFGCPVPKVTRRGGGGALPWKQGLLGEILSAAVRTSPSRSRFHGRAPPPPRRVILGTGQPKLRSTWSTPCSAQRISVAFPTYAGSVP